MTRFKIEKQGPSAYRQLYAQLKEALVSGAYPPGSRLPSKRALAAELGISVITVEHALALLADEGWVEPRERSGVYALPHGGGVHSPGHGLSLPGRHRAVGLERRIELLHRLLQALHGAAKGP